MPSTARAWKWRPTAASNGITKMLATPARRGTTSGTPACSQVYTSPPDTLDNSRWAYLLFLNNTCDYQIFSTRVINNFLTVDKSTPLRTIKISQIYLLLIHFDKRLIKIPTFLTCSVLNYDFLQNLKNSVQKMVLILDKEIIFSVNYFVCRIKVTCILLKSLKQSAVQLMTASTQRQQICKNLNKQGHKLSLFLFTCTFCGCVKINEFRIKGSLDVDK